MIDHALYLGHVWHARQVPARHAFRYPLWWVWLHLGEENTLLSRSPWWGRRWRPVTFREQDYLDAEAGSLRDRVIGRAARLGMDWQAGEVCLLASPRLFGWISNPLALYWHFPPGESRPDAVLAEVRNTPWHERHWYALPVEANGTDSWSVTHPKAFHVSPFMPLTQSYQWRFTMTSEVLKVVIENHEEHGRVFSAGVSLLRQPATPGGLARCAWRGGLQGISISLAIYLHAWKLWRKGVPIYRHPARATRGDQRDPAGAGKTDRSRSGAL